VVAAVRAVEVAAAAAVAEINGHMDKLVLQWHVTSACNLRCVHCYQENTIHTSMDLNHINYIAESYVTLLQKLGMKGHINLTGGEPLLHSGFIEILEMFHSRKSFFTFGILTNGLLIDEAMLTNLNKYKPEFVQVSLDGNKEIHDSMRGQGTFDRTCKTIKLLSRAGIKVLVSFTATKDNFRSFPEVYDAARKNGAFKVWTDRVVPFGNGKAFIDKMIGKEDIIEYLDILKRCKLKKPVLFKRKPIVDICRALQFLSGEGTFYSCSAGNTLITVMEDGTVYPCRRFPVDCGNVLSEPLTDIYINAAFLKELRNKKDIKGCTHCSYIYFCNGGARCISYAYYGTPFISDPACPLSR
jgi:radical SAM protein with 4Fe4S-binding SPASM domain